MCSLLLGTTTFHRQFELLLEEWVRSLSRDSLLSPLLQRLGRQGHPPRSHVSISGMLQVCDEALSPILIESEFEIRCGPSLGYLEVRFSVCKHREFSSLIPSSAPCAEQLTLHGPSPAGQAGPLTEVMGVTLGPGW